MITSNVIESGSGSLYLVAGLKNSNCQCGNDKEIHGPNIECYDKDKLMSGVKNQ